MNSIFYKSGKFKQIRQQYFELVFWVAAVSILFFMPLTSTAKSLCLFSRIGILHCPGCGIAHAITAALHLQFSASFHYHPMGIFAVFIICNRIKQLTFKSNKINHGQQPFNKNDTLCRN